MPRTLLLEIGCEELPTSFVRNALEQLGKLAADELARARIPHGDVRTLGTARRLSILVRGVSESIAARTEELIGPAESASRAPDGKWTKAAEGFARKNEIPLESLTVADTPKGRYLRAEKLHPGARTADRLAESLHAMIAKITFTKSMRWADIETPFGRPIQWIVALYGHDIVPLEFVRIRSGRTTRGHRFLAPAPIDLATSDDYVATLRSAHVLVDVDERRRVQHEVLEHAATAENGELVRNAFLENEVLGLVEQPFVVVGHFDQAFLSLPDELIETVMSHHQRYFAVRAKGGGRLLPTFITTVNTALDPATIRKGNERVMTARLADARFFVDQDRATTLDSRIPRLDGVVYHQKLGSYGDKVARLEKLAIWLAPQFNADEAQAQRAARLCKADLVSLTVGEFPELQGIMGADYARNDKEPAPVAVAIAEHYLPRGADDAPPETHLGSTVSVADRFDTLVGFFAIGQKPSGGGDPFGLRRAAIGMLRTLLHHRIRLSIDAAAAQAYAGYTRELPRDAAATGADLSEFIRERLEGILVQKFPLDVVRACVASGHDDPVDVLERVEALAAFRATPAFVKVARAFERVFNISRQAPAGEPDVSVMQLPAEIALLEAFGATRPQLRTMIADRHFTAALELLAESLPDPVDRFFTEVFVMDENESLRGARLRMLGRIADEVGGLARFDTLAAATTPAA